MCAHIKIAFLCQRLIKVCGYRVTYLAGENKGTEAVADFIDLDYPFTSPQNS